MSTTRISLVLLFLALLGAAPPVAASDEIELQYRRDRKNQAATTPQTRTSLPEALRLPTPELPSTEAATEAPADNRRKVDTIRDPTSPPPADPQNNSAELQRQAAEAAAWAAREVARTRGRHNYYQAGFYHGLHAAFDHPGLGRRDEREGEEDGRRDPEALRRGGELGGDEADSRAEETAAQTVAAQFHDLSREPRPEPLARRWDFQPRLPRVREPGLDRVMADYPLDRFLPGRSFGPTPDPWEIYNYRSYGEVYDGRWQRPAVGLELWRDEDRRRGLWRSLDENGRALFERVFVRAYPHWLGRERPGLERAWDDGWDDGWRYGVFVVGEHSYRRGYRAGYTHAFVGAASAAFDRLFPRAYEASYRSHFDDWMSSARPELRDVWLEDEDDDGVFEPGEEALVSYEIVNYGGRPLDTEARLAGSVLQRDAIQPVLVPRRASWRAPRPLAATIDTRTRPRTETQLTLTIADVREELPLRVAYPLELDREVALRAQDTADGRASLDFAVRNQSRRAASGSAELMLDDGQPGARRVDLGTIEAGARRPLGFEIEGLDPLELVAGEAEVRVVLRERDTVFDELSYRFPDRVSDLARRDLIEVMVELALGPRPDPTTIVHAHRLTLRRLEADWQAAARGRGNVYQEDLEKGTRASALGDLVATWRGNRGALRHPEVFTGLAPRVRELAETLPGTHPFLRRSFKRLARELED